MSKRGARPSHSSGVSFQTKPILTIVSGHFAHDVYTAFISPLLPLLMRKLSLSLTQSGALAAAIQLPSILSPFIGYLADRINLRYFVILAPAVTATLVSMLGLASSYPTLLLLLLTCGISVAAFHAPAPAMISRLSGDRVGKGMSFFMAAGELGRTLGPLLAVWAVSMWTLQGVFRVVILGWAASLFLFIQLRAVPARTDKPAGFREMLPKARRLFGPLLWVLLLRNFLLSSIAVYLPTFMTLGGANLWVAGGALSVFEIAGVFGALLSGTLSDLIGRKPVLMTGLVAAPLLTLIFLEVEGPWRVVVLLALGFTGLSTGPVMLAIVQEHLPSHRALANGLFLSMVFLTRPPGVVIAGLIGDHWGLETTFTCAAIACLMAVPAVMLLPSLDGFGTSQSSES